MVSFFFKQKTAYEMRISDWISDVCSSDLTLQGTEMRYEARTKNGAMHGWQIIHPTEYDGTPIPGQRNCYQNGGAPDGCGAPSACCARPPSRPSRPGASNDMPPENRASPPPPPRTPAHRVFNRPPPPPPPTTPQTNT